jgi:hypothetical protein
MAWRTVLTLMLATATAFATSSGGPIKCTGAAVDGGLTCLQCHNQFAPPVNQGAGRVLVSVNAYTPGFKYSLNVQVTDPSARWEKLPATVRSNSLRIVKPRRAAVSAGSAPSWWSGLPRAEMWVR